MEIDPQLQKELVATFKDELDERLQVMTEGLLYLEKNDKKDEIYTKMIDAIFRAAHNIKGAARGIGINDVGDISHHLESLFTAIKNNEIKVSKDLIDLTLEAVDSMRSVMTSFIENKSTNIDIKNLLLRLQYGEVIPKKIIQKDKIDKQILDNKQTVKNEYESIRVTLNNIDRVSALVEEIQVNKIAMEDYFADLTKLSMKMNQFFSVWKQTFGIVSNHYKSGMNDHLKKLFNADNDNFIELNNTVRQLHKNLLPKINELSILSSSLQEEVHFLRLVPVSDLLRGFLRTTRDLSNSLNKQIELDIRGNDVNMDKMVLDSLKDPITHILRNAIDHGIESIDDRLKAGKSQVGHIIIDVKEEGNQIFLTFTDDGAGINLKKIAGIAENKHIVTQVELQNMTDSDILNLIFLPGFSTKEVITDISGRGVGLDVVKSNLDILKGSVQVNSILGKGTTFTLRVPLTLTSELGLMISSVGQPFVIPMNGVERVLILRMDEIIEIEANQAILLDNHPIPLRILSDLLKFERKEIANVNQLSIIVLKKDKKIVALLVDEIIGEREIVIKPLQSPSTNVSCVVGGTLSGKGQVIIVLSASDLIDAAFHMEHVNCVSVENKKTKQDTKPHILVVDDSITTRTLEKNILESNHYQVTLAVNGKEAWDLLQNKSFSLLITDVSMPIMDGFTLTERVKQSNHLRDLPVIIVTSLGSDAENKRGVEIGANAYIVKNEFESDTLLEVVSQLV